MKEYNVAIVGIGGVGTEMLRILKQRNFPCKSLQIFARSTRDEVVDGVTYNVKGVTEDGLDSIDIAFFAGGEKAEDHYGWKALERRKTLTELPKLTVIDNGNAFRMYPNVPLVVPEVNPEALKNNNGLIASPNCSTIQMVAALKPLHDVAKIKRVVVSTYQAVSGKSADARAELLKQTNDVAAGNAPVVDTNIFPYPIYGNCLPHIDSFLDDGYTKEELKVIQETRKIMSDDTMLITCTAVRVPVDNCHAESVNVEFYNPLSAKQAHDIWENTPGIIVQDAVKNNIYPLQSEASGRDEVFVGRIRDDYSIPNGTGLNFWVVSDNLRKGAALNTIQIAEKMMEMGLL